MWSGKSPSVRFLLRVLPLALLQAPTTEAALERLPEEVTITGSGDLFELRRQLFEAEKRAYDVFNRFNDDERFHISCSTHQPTGTRFKRQVCTPEFQLRATSAHAAMVLESFSRNREAVLAGISEQLSPLESFPAPIIPMEAVIARQQEDYRRKLREVAAQHPEFREALIEYTRLREDYSTATGRTAP